MTYQPTTVRCTGPHLPQPFLTFFGARNLRLRVPAIVTRTKRCYALVSQTTATSIGCTSRLLNRTCSAWASTYFLDKHTIFSLSDKGVKNYLARPRASDLTLFAHADESFLTPLCLTSMLRSLLHKLGYNEDHYTDHSFRIGAATTAAAAGLPDWLIKTIVRWPSDCYQQYIQLNGKPLSSVANTLAKAHIPTNFPSWSTD